MRFLIILAAALAVTWAGSYGGGYGPRVGFNAHSLDIPVGGGSYMGVQGMRGVNVGGRGRLGGAVGRVGLSTGLRGSVMTGGSLGVMDDTYLTGTAGLAGNSMGLRDTVDVYGGTGGDRVYGGAIYDVGDGGYDLDYNLVDGAAMPDSRVTVLTKENRGLFGHLLDRVSGPTYQLQQGLVLQQGNVGGGLYQPEYVSGAVYGPQLVSGGGYLSDDGYQGGVAGQLVGGGDYVAGIGTYPMFEGAGGLAVGGPVVGGAGGLEVGGPMFYPGGGMGNAVGGAFNAVGNVATGAANFAGNLAGAAIDTTANVAGGLASGVHQGLNALGK